MVQCCDVPAPPQIQPSTVPVLTHMLLLGLDGAFTLQIWRAIMEMRVSGNTFCKETFAAFAVSLHEQIT